MLLFLLAGIFAVPCWFAAVLLSSRSVRERLVRDTIERRSELGLRSNPKRAHWALVLVVPLLVIVGLVAVVGAFLAAFPR